MAITDAKKNVLLGQGVEEQVKNIDDNFTSLFDTADDLNDAIKNSGFITKDANNLTNYTLKSETGTDIELSIDTTTYVMTINLKNASGTVVSTANVDFPIESMVVNASYAGGTLTLTLQNGTTLDVDISAMISGLVPETRKVNGKQLKADITLTHDDIGDGTTYKRYSQTEKTKLAGIAEGANKYVHPSYPERASGFYKITVDATGHVSAVTAVTKADITGLGIPAQDTTYQPATESANGLMSSADKKKLNAIDSSLQGVTADEIGKVKDVTVNGESVLNSNGTAVITISELKSGYVSITTSDSRWTTKTVNGTTYQALKVEKTSMAIEVYNSNNQKIVAQNVFDDSYLYICVGTAKIACTLRTMSGSSVGGGVFGEWKDCTTGSFPVENGDTYMFMVKPYKSLQSKLGYTGYYMTPPMTIFIGEDGYGSVRSPILGMKQSDTNYTSTTYFYVDFNKSPSGGYLSCTYGTLGTKEQSKGAFAEVKYRKLG